MHLTTCNEQPSSVNCGKDASNILVLSRGLNIIHAVFFGIAHHVNVGNVLLPQTVQFVYCVEWGVKLYSLTPVRTGVSQSRPSVWNSLTDYLHVPALELNGYRRRLKTLLFAHYLRYHEYTRYINLLFIYLFTFIYRPIVHECILDT